MSSPRIELVGHLTEPALRRALEALEKSLPESGPAGVIIDCRKMTDYDLGARHAFVDWHAKNRTRVRRVAVITENRVWWMVISAMSLAAGTPMKGVGTDPEAAAFLDG